MKNAEEYLRRLRDQILESDRSVRFIGIPNKKGRQIVSSSRNKVTLLLTLQEIEMFAIESVLRMNARKGFESKLGKPIYSFTLYEKVKRATITLESKEYPILIISFDIKGDMTTS